MIMIKNVFIYLFVCFNLLLLLLLSFVHTVNISGIHCCFGCIEFYYMDKNAHTLVWGPILTNAFASNS